MNQRQKLKRLKRDNKLMRSIIKNTPEMEMLYNAYNQPCNVTYSAMSFQRYACRATIPSNMPNHKEYTKRELLEKLAEAMKDDIQYEVKRICGEKVIEASVYIGRKEGTECSARMDTNDYIPAMRSNSL